MKKICLVLIFVTLFSFSCSKDSVKPSEDLILTNEAIDSIRSIQSAYERKNRGVLKSRLAPELADRILEGLSFNRAALVLTPRMVRINETSVSVNMNWRGSWWSEKGEMLENRGAADLVLDKETMKLMQINGDSPFSVPLISGNQ